MHGVQTFLNGIEIARNIFVPFLGALSVIVFLWGVVVYLLSSGHEGEREKGKKLMLWGNVALFIMIVVWGMLSAFGGWAGPTLGPSEESNPATDLGNINTIEEPGARVEIR